MREAEVREDDLHQGPILLVVKVLYPVGLESLHLVQGLWKLQEDDGLEVQKEAAVDEVVE